MNKTVVQSIVAALCLALGFGGGYLVASKTTTRRTSGNGSNNDFRNGDRVAPSLSSRKPSGSSFRI